MNQKMLYHGSSFIIKEPLLSKGKIYNDYGQAFYCTENIEMAKEWACSDKGGGFANKYSIALDGLTVLDLSSPKYTVLNWLAILLENRIINPPTPLAKRGKDFIINNYLIPYKDYDVIVGYRADDSYFSFARAFITNQISLSQLESAMKLGKLGIQVALKSEKAVSRLRFEGFEEAEGSTYYPRRKSRDLKARNDFTKMLENECVGGVFIRDLLENKNERL